MTIEELRARLAEIDARITELDAEAGEARMADEARDEWNTLNEERDDVAASIQEFEARKRRVAEIAATAKPDQKERGDGAGAHFNVGRVEQDIYDVESYRTIGSTPQEESRAIVDGARRAIEEATFEHEDINREDAQEHAEKLVKRHGRTFAERVLLTGSPDYKRAFAKSALGLPLTQDEVRAMSLTGANGGFAVPFTLDPTVIPTSSGVVNPLRAISRVETVTTNIWKGVTSAGSSAAYAAEGTEASDNSFTLAQPELTCQRAQHFVPYSREVGGDWSALLSEIAKNVANAKDALESTKFLNGAGSGSNEPSGLLTGATGTVAAGSAAFAVAHLYDLDNALAPRWQSNARFLASNYILNKVRQFDTSGGASLWVQLRDGTPPALLGKPVHQYSEMAAALTNGSKIMVVGDFEQFLIVDRLGMSIELIPHLFGASGRPTGQAGAYAIWRNTSGVLTANAFKVLQTTAS